MSWGHLSRRGKAIRIVFFAVVIMWMVLSGSGVVAAQSNNSTDISDKAPYYANESTDVANETWMAGMENATLPNQIGMLLRLGSVVVGPGPTVPGGAGPSGPMLFGFLLLGGLLSAVVGTDMGAVAAVVLFVAGISGVVTIGLVPGWLFAVLLFGLGVLAFRTFQSVIQ